MIKINLKLKTKDSKKTMGQSIAEYALLIAVVSAALLAMQIYMKRGIQSVIKYSADQLGNQEYMETNAERAMSQNIAMRSTSQASMRIQEEGAGDSSKVTSTFNQDSDNTGVSTSWQDHEL
ncbi:MAG: hypothetical protein PHS34_06955 [Candidatus Omnitrophica bacterium]|nr:hypothetical protein [Candidatus Omnitrophota bacterium]MDD5550987.1 hypothetical protein [Candidatus Omnitrophota bacterium]